MDRTYSLYKTQCWNPSLLVRGITTTTYTTTNVVCSSTTQFLSQLRLQPRNCGWICQKKMLPAMLTLSAGSISSTIVGSMSLSPSSIGIIPCLCLMHRDHQHHQNCSSCTEPHLRSHRIRRLQISADGTDSVDSEPLQATTVGGGSVDCGVQTQDLYKLKYDDWVGWPFRRRQKFAALELVGLDGFGAYLAAARCLPPASPEFSPDQTWLPATISHQVFIITSLWSPAI